MKVAITAGTNKLTGESIERPQKAPARASGGEVELLLGHFGLGSGADDGINQGMKSSCK